MLCIITTTESPRGTVDVGHRSRQAVEEEDEDGEGHVIPSFQNAFNEALLSASVSVLAAQSGESLVVIKCITAVHLFTIVFVACFLQHLVGGLVARRQRRVERSLCCSPQAA